MKHKKSALGMLLFLGAIAGSARDRADINTYAKVLAKTTATGNDNAAASLAENRFPLYRIPISS